ALTRLTYAAVPAFVARGRGTLINIASIVGVAPELLNGVYGGTKAFVLALSRSLRHELAGTGMRVQVVLPGASATECGPVAGGAVGLAGEMKAGPALRVSGFAARPNREAFGPAAATVGGAVMSIGLPRLVTGAAGRVGGVGGAMMETLRQRDVPARALVRRND